VSKKARTDKGGMPSHSLPKTLDVAAEVAAEIAEQNVADARQDKGDVPGEADQPEQPKDAKPKCSAAKTKAKHTRKRTKKEAEPEDAKDKD